MTAQKGIKVGGHMIFGLPGESRDKILHSAEIISELPLNNVKFHQLQLFRGTKMAEDYSENPDDFYIFELDDYLEFVADYLELLNPAFVVERIAGEVPPRYAVLRPWGPRYDSILTKFEKLLESRNSWQGKRYGEKKQH